MTAVFGMGTGRTTTSWPPKNRLKFASFQCSVSSEDRARAALLEHFHKLYLKDQSCLRSDHYAGLPRRSLSEGGFSENYTQRILGNNFPIPERKIAVLST